LFFIPNLFLDKFIKSKMILTQWTMWRDHKIYIATLCVSLGAGLAWWSHRADFSAKKPVTLTHPPAPSAPVKLFDISFDERIKELPAPTKVWLEKTRLRAEKHPDQPTGWIEVGQALMQAQRDTQDTRFFDEAIIVYDYALHLAPQQSVALIGLAAAYGGKHEFARSIEYAQRAISLDPAQVEAYGIWGDALVERGEYEAALEHYQTMMNLRPDLSSWSRGAHLLWQMGKKTAALSLMERALRAGGPHAENTDWCRVQLAHMHFQQGAVVVAKAALAPALRENGGLPSAWTMAGRIALSEENYPQARIYFLRANAKQPQPLALALLGDMAALENDHTTAKMYYGQVKAVYELEENQNASHSGEHSHLGLAKFLADHDDSLIVALRLAEQVKLSPHVSAADTVAWVFYKNGLIPQAVEAMKRALRYESTEPEVHYHAGLIALSAGDILAAQRHLQQSLALNPAFHPLHALEAQKALHSLSKRNGNTAKK
jgi:tetratricopeptide (TPR) repeat protein